MSDFGSMKGSSIFEVGIPLLQINFTPYIPMLLFAGLILIGWLLLLGFFGLFLGLWRGVVWFPPICRGGFHPAVFVCSTRQGIACSPSAGPFLCRAARSVSLGIKGRLVFWGRQMLPGVRAAGSSSVT